MSVPQPDQPYPQRPYQPHPPYQPPPQQPQAGEGLVIDVTSPPVLLSWAGMITPVITVNDWPLPTSTQGRNALPLPPGPYRVHVHLPYVMPKRMGPADCQVTVQPGQWVHLEYKPPLWSFSRGSLGPPPQSYNGLVPMVAVIGGCMLFVLLMLVIAAL